MRNKEGALFGTTTGGSPLDLSGTVFKLTPSVSTYTERVLHLFNGSTGDGAYPTSTLVTNRTGYLYGTTQVGGHFADGTGTVFRVKP